MDRQAERQTDGQLAGGQTGGHSEKWDPAQSGGSGSLRTGQTARVSHSKAASIVESDGSVSPGFD